MLSTTFWGVTACALVDGYLPAELQSVIFQKALKITVSVLSVVGRY
jgi:hypothetical protein